MNILKSVRWVLFGTPTPPTGLPEWNKPIPVAPKKTKSIKMSLAARAKGWLKPQKTEDKRPVEGQMRAFKIPKPMPGVIPDDPDIKMAMDAREEGFGSLYGFAESGFFGEGLGFMGYPYLAELTQRPEYRKMSEIIAEEMTRKWIKIEGSGDDDKSAKIKIIEEDLKRLNARDEFRKAAELDGFFGLSHIYLDTGYTEDRTELLIPLMMASVKFHDKQNEPGFLQAIRAIDPTWTAPNNYNSTDPLAPNFYKPLTWFVMGKEISSTRLLTIISRPVPDLLKPAYNFGGLSLTQMAKPYVDNWIRTRQSVSDLIHSFTVFILKTNMAGILGGGDGDDEFARVDLFERARDNRGLMMTDKDTEELDNISVPLSGLDKLQAQAQEQMCSVSSIPLVKFTGISPTGLNASSAGEIRVFSDHIHARQERIFRKPLATIIEIIQLCHWGVVDPDINFRFIPLHQLDEKEEAEVRKMNAETDASYIAQQVLDPADVRKALASEDGSRYTAVDLDLPPPTPIETGLPPDDDPSGTLDPSQKLDATGDTPEAAPDTGSSIPMPGMDSASGTTEQWDQQDHGRSAGGSFAKNDEKTPTNVGGEAGPLKRIYRGLAYANLDEMKKAINTDKEYVPVSGVPTSHDQQYAVNFAKQHAGQGGVPALITFISDKNIDIPGMVKEMPKGVNYSKPTFLGEKDGLYHFQVNIYHVEHNEGARE